jgi:hypothetical protein
MIDSSDVAAVLIVIVIALEHRGQRVTVVRKVRQAEVGKARAGPSGSLKSRTKTRSGVDATSTQPPCAPL